MQPIAYTTPGSWSAGNLSFASPMSNHFICRDLMTVRISSGASPLLIASLMPFTEGIEPRASGCAARIFSVPPSQCQCFLSFDWCVRNGLIDFINPVRPSLLTLEMVWNYVYLSRSVQKWLTQVLFDKTKKGSDHLQLALIKSPIFTMNKEAPNHQQCEMFKLSF